MNKDILLIIKHTQVPAKGEKTHTKEWGKSAKWDIYEEATVTDSPKKWLVSEASVIINVSKMKIEKNRNTQLDAAAVKELYVNCMTKYQENIVQFYVKYRPEVLNEMVRARAAEESQKLAADAKSETEARLESLDELTAESQKLDLY
jgi:hypothetical protein